MNAWLSNNLWLLSLVSYTRLIQLAIYSNAQLSFASSILREYSNRISYNCNIVSIWLRCPPFAFIIVYQIFSCDVCERSTLQEFVESLLGNVLLRVREERGVPEVQFSIRVNGGDAILNHVSAPGAYIN